MTTATARACLEELLSQRTDLWRGTGRVAVAESGVASGFSALDAVLVGGGWPRAGLCEILTQCPGPGLALILPALIRLLGGGLGGGLRGELGGERPWILIAAPPLLPYAPALAARGLDPQRLLVVRESHLRGVPVTWVMEQGLQAGCCLAVVGWMGRGAGAALRRLQLAAVQSQTLAFVFRPPSMARQPSPAGLRLQIASSRDGDIELNLLKQPGRSGAIRLRLEEA
jgi:cell division inhibitor SulA/protein ImuA